LKKNILKELLWIFIPFLLFLLITVVWFLLPDSSATPVFIGKSDYLQMILKDNIFKIALWNTLKITLILLLGGLILGGLTSFFTRKRKKIFWAVSISVCVILCAGILYFMLYNNDYDFRNIGLLSVNLILSGIICVASAFFILSALAFKKKSIFLKNGFVYGGIWLVSFLSICLNSAMTAIIGFPSSDYSPNTIMNHLSDYSQPPKFTFPPFFMPMLAISGLLAGLMYFSVKNIFGYIIKRKSK